VGHREPAGGAELGHGVAQLLGHREPVAGVVETGDHALHARVPARGVQGQDDVADGGSTLQARQAGHERGGLRLGQLLAQVGDEDDAGGQRRAGQPARHPPGADADREDR
jgi:hypothetical protein